MAFPFDSLDDNPEAMREAGARAARSTAMQKWQEERAEALAKIVVDGFLEVRDICNEAQGLNPIPIAERLPEIGLRCQWFDIREQDWYYGKRVAWKDEGDEWWSPEDSGEVFPIRQTVSHWMPKPSPPSGDDCGDGEVRKDN